MKNFFAIFLYMITFTVSESQSISRLHCDVTIDEKLLENAFSGGLNSPQFNTMDINKDGKYDLIVFDRVGNKLNVFIMNDENDYEFAPHYNSIFPELSGWMLLIDYNGDGNEDIFASKNGGFEVWKSLVSGNLIKFEKIKNSKYGEDILTYKDSNGQIMLQCDNSDIPSVVDLDSDGDFDILSFAGTNSIYHYKNLTSENNISKDSFRFVLAETCWGKFIEHPLNETILLSEDPDRCAEWGFANPRHIGSTMMTFDRDNDGDYDIILGDVGSEKVNFIKNGGNKYQAWGTELEAGFPENDIPVDLYTFIGIFQPDIDGDGKRDLIFAPNAISNEPFPQTINNIHFYKNISSGQNAEFEYVTDKFLSESMIDLGGRVYPVFVDIDNDGLTDLIAGTGPVVDNDTILPSHLVLFKNVGTKSVPVFKLTDSDFLSFSSISKNLQLNYFAPSFGDIDNDGDDDLLVGNHEGTLIFMENISTSDELPKFAEPIMNYKNLIIQSFSAPLIIDVNKDGLKDILIGCGQDFHTPLKYYGSIVYFQNKGITGSPDFESDPFMLPNTPEFGNIKLSNAYLNTSNAYLSSYTDSDDEYLIAGNYFGKVNIYTDLSKSIYQTNTPLYKDYGSINIGSNAAPSVADIDDDGYLEMIIGTPRGGFELWDTDIKVKGKVSTNDINYYFNVYPNPFQSYINIDNNIYENSFAKVTLYDIFGRPVVNQIISPGNNKINTNKLSCGTYFLKIRLKDKIINYKFIKSIF
ncbi:MAG: T9SS type A sorting domain-containing protein [Deltaproteobacteria bacterium]